MEAQAPQVGLPLGARLAGGVLLLNGFAGFAELFIPRLNDPTAGILNSPLHIVIDVAVGVALIRGVTKWQKIAIARVLLGALLFGGAAAAKEDWFQAGFQALFSAALLGLLWGDAGRLRLGLSGAATLLLVTVEAVGLYAVSTGRHPLASLVLASRGEIPWSAVGEIRGERATWSLSFPRGRWYLRSSAAAARDNPLVDRWMTDPGRDMHVLVIAEPLDAEMKLDADKLMKVVLDNARGAATSFEIVDAPAPLASGVGPARIAHSASTINGISVETYHAVFLTKEIAFQVLGFGPAPRVGEAGDELKQIIRSFSR